MCVLLPYIPTYMYTYIHTYTYIVSYQTFCIRVARRLCREPALDLHFNGFVNLAHNLVEVAEIAVHRAVYCLRRGVTV